MPRLTNTDYYQRYRLLRYLLEQHTAVFAGTLNEEERFALYNYYEFYRDLTKAQSLQHRKDITEVDPGLPARASKVFTKLEQTYKRQVVAPKQKRAQHKRGKVTGVTVTAERREEIDWDRYAWALLQHCRGVIENEKQA